MTGLAGKDAADERAYSTGGGEDADRDRPSAERQRAESGEEHPGLTKGHRDDVDEKRHPNVRGFSEESHPVGQRLEAGSLYLAFGQQLGERENAEERGQEEHDVDRVRPGEPDTGDQYTGECGANRDH